MEAGELNGLAPAGALAVAAESAFAQIYFERTERDRPGRAGLGAVPAAGACFIIEPGESPEFGIDFSFFNIGDILLPLFNSNFYGIEHVIISLKVMAAV
jgi:hypothetical protein